jgi:hypothetical protein
MTERDEMRVKFQEILRPFAESLRDYAVACIQRPITPMADSPAMSELHDEKRWSVEEWLEPARNAHSYGLVLAYFVVDHADSYAAIAISAELGPTFAHATLLRSVMEVATNAAWLLEPSIGAEKRIQRSTVYRIDSAVNLGRMGTAFNADEGATKGRERAIAYAKGQGWEVVNLGQGGRKSVGGEAMPMPEQGFRAVLPYTPSEDFCRALWNYMSATSHGSFYAVQQSLQTPPDAPEPSPFDPAGMTKAIGADTANVITIGAVLFHLVQGVVQRRDALMGWTPTEDEIAAAKRLDDIILNTPSRFGQ